MIIYQVLAIIVLCICLIFSTGLIINAIREIASKSKLGAFGITAFILAISTSLPELVVSIVAAIEGNTSLILGNIIGSNIADLSLVIGGAAIIGGSLKVTGEIISRDIYLAGAAGFLPIFLIADGTLSRPDGVVLLVVYLMMVATFLKSHHTSLAKHVITRSPMRRLFSAITDFKGNGGVSKFFLGIAILLLSSHFIVKLSTSLALSTGLPTIFIGLFVVAVGTSLPELAFEIKAIAKGQSKMALGDLLGSIVANATLILGIASLIRPLTLTSRGLIPYGVAISALGVIYIAFLYFVKTKKKLEWWEGALLSSGYLIFFMIEYFNQ